MNEDAFHADVFDNCDDGGGDLRFSSDEAGSTQLSCEVKDFDTTNDEATVWVKVPTLDYDDDTIIYIWGDNTGDSQPAVGASYGSDDVWSAARYVGIFHLHDDLLDSTASSNDGTMVSSPSYGATQTGRGLTFDGTDDSITVPSVMGLSSTGTSLLVWANITNSNDGGIYIKVGSGTTGWSFGVGEGTYNAATPTGNECISLYDNKAWVDTNANYGTGNMLLVGVVESDNDFFCYKNGVQLGTKANPATPNAANTISYIGGYDPSGSNPRYANVVISEAWFVDEEMGTDLQVTLYNNMNSVSTFGTAAASASAETAAVVPVGMEVTIPAVTATWIAIVDAAVVAVGMTLTPPAVTAVVGLAVEAAVVPVGMTLATTAVTATFVIEKSAAVVPLIIELTPTAVTATYTSEFTDPSKVAYDPLLDEITYHTHPWHTSVVDLRSKSAGFGATLVGTRDAGGYYDGSNVEAILQELGQRVYDLENP